MTNRILVIVGTRNPTRRAALAAFRLAASAQAQGFTLWITDARGISRSAALGAWDHHPPTVFSAHFSGPGALPARASAMLRAAAGQPGSTLAAFPAGPCPEGITPAQRWTSGSPPSGTWSEIALAIGLGLQVGIGWPLAEVAPLPPWPGGRWRYHSRAFGCSWIHWTPDQTALWRGE
jgi:hypothetical protein